MWHLLLARRLSVDLYAWPQIIINTRSDNAHAPSVYYLRPIDTLFIDMLSYTPRTQVPAWYQAWVSKSQKIPRSKLVFNLQCCRKTILFVHLLYPLSVLSIFKNVKEINWGIKLETMPIGLHCRILPVWKELRMDTEVLLYYCFLNWQDPINLLERVKLTLTAYPSSDCHVC